MRVSDEDLVRRGAELGSGQVLLIACGALAREIVALQRVGHWVHLTLRCLPAILHNSPQDIPSRIRDAIQQGRADGFQTILIGYADCGTGGLLDEVCEDEGVERI